MQIANIKNFTNGWFIGAFQPSLIDTDKVEVAYHFYAKGFVGQPHIHKIATEVNLIVKGLVSVGKHMLGNGDIWLFEPEEYEQVEFMEDTHLIIIKTPSIPTDKYPI